MTSRLRGITPLCVPLDVQPTGCINVNCYDTSEDTKKALMRAEIHEKFATEDDAVQRFDHAFVDFSAVAASLIFK